MIKDCELEEMAKTVAAAAANMIVSGTGKHWDMSKEKYRELLAAALATAFETGWSAAAEYERSGQGDEGFVYCEVERAK